MDTLKVALASDWFYPKIGGIETHIHELALNLLKLGFEPHVITHDYRLLGGYDDSTLPYPVHRIRGPIYFREHHISVGPATPARINDIMKLYKFDVMHVHSIYSPLAMVAANVSRGVRGVPVVATNHSFFEWNSMKYTRFLPLIRYALKRVDLIVAVSTPVARDTLKVLGPRLSNRIPVLVIPNAVDTSFWRPPEPEERRRARRLLGLGEHEFVVLSVGRLTPRKRLHAAPRIVAWAARRGGRRLTLLLVGDGPLKSFVERLAQAYTASNGVRIVWRGFVPRRELRSYYWASDIVLIPGLSEAMPITALEAMACGRPVVGFRGTGLEDVAVGPLSRLLASSDSQAAEIIASLSRDSNMLAEMSSRAALNIAGRFEWRKVIWRIVEAYRLAIGLGHLEDRRYPIYKLWLHISALARGRRGAV